MSKYQEKERAKAIDLIENSELFEGCKAGEKFMGKEREFVLSDRNYNLFKTIREQTETYFKENVISWWGGQRPTPHTLVCWAYSFTNRVQVPVCAALGGSISEWQGCCG